MKNKIEPGQCYVFEDHVFMVTSLHGAIPKMTFWNIQNTLTKEYFIMCEDVLLKLRRPFHNFG
jgi:hypothetical protein